MAGSPALSKLQDIADGYRGVNGSFYLNAPDAASLTELSGQNFSPGMVGAGEFVAAVDGASRGKPLSVETTNIEQSAESKSEKADTGDDVSKVHKKMAKSKSEKADTGNDVSKVHKKMAKRK